MSPIVYSHASLIYQPSVLSLPWFMTFSVLWNYKSFGKPLPHRNTEFGGNLSLCSWDMVTQMAPELAIPYFLLEESCGFCGNSSIHESIILNSASMEFLGQGKDGFCQRSWGSPSSLLMCIYVETTVEEGIFLVVVPWIEPRLLSARQLFCRWAVASVRSGLLM